MRKLAPAEFEAWLNLNNIVAKDGAIPKKYRELIAIGVALTTQCPFCIEAHAKAAKAAGATREELVEAAFVAAALRGGRRRHARHDGVEVLRPGVTALLVALGGGARRPGAILGSAWRSKATLPAGAFPMGTLVVNVSGCFAMGVLSALADRPASLSPGMRGVPGGGRPGRIYHLFRFRQ